MTKADIITEIATKTGIDKTDVAASLEAFFTVVKGSLSKGEPVYVRGFGSFIIKHRKEKVGRIISKGESVVIPAHNVPSFKPSKVFVEKVKSGTDNVKA